MYLTTPPTVALALAAALCAITVQAQMTTGRLNDTGQTLCDSGSYVMAACSSANTGDAAPLPRQDGRFGRDAAMAGGALTKAGGGAAAFDFTRLCWNGAPEGTTSGPNTCTGTLVANTGGAPSGTPATDWACTKDNVTGLVWSLQTQGPTNWTTANAAAYPNVGHNTSARCGFGSGWRMPTVRELLSVVHNGLPNYSTALVDMAYFPGTQATPYWSGEGYASLPTTAWIVDFSHGSAGANGKSGNALVLLVYGAP